MKTAIQMVQDVHSVINVTQVTSIISGSIYLYERPKNSDKLDVVINSLLLTADQIQAGVVNVNTHAPNLKGSINGNVDTTMPDIAKMIEIGNVLANLLADVNGFDFKLSVSFPGLPIKDVDGSWFLNIRVNYISIQQKFTNI